MGVLGLEEISFRRYQLGRTAQCLQLKVSYLESKLYSSSKWFVTFQFVECFTPVYSKVVNIELNKIRIVPRYYRYFLANATHWLSLHVYTRTEIYSMFVSVIRAYTATFPEGSILSLPGISWRLNTIEHSGNVAVHTIHLVLDSYWLSVTASFGWK